MGEFVVVSTTRRVPSDWLIHETTWDVFSASGPDWNFDMHAVLVRPIDPNSVEVNISQDLIDTDIITPLLTINCNWQTLLRGTLTRARNVRNEYQIGQLTWICRLCERTTGVCGFERR